MALQLTEKIHYPSHVRAVARWLVGQDAFEDQAYLVHTEYPAFFAKVGIDEDEGLLSGVSYAMRDDRSLYDFVWYDPFPGETGFLSLMREAEDALASFFQTEQA